MTLGCNDKQVDVFFSAGSLRCDVIQGVFSLFYELFTFTARTWKMLSYRFSQKNIVMMGISRGIFKNIFVFYGFL